MKIVHINNADNSGGAARAAYRIHNSLIEKALHSRMWVNFAKTGDWTVIGPKRRWEKAIKQMRSHLIAPLLGTMQTQNNILHSPAILPSSWSKRINNSDFDIVNLHWVGGEMVSVKDIGRIKKPTIWTLHDMWAFCGAEHYSLDKRWCDGYKKNNRLSNESGFDINRWTWKRKIKHWKNPIQIVAVSNWLAECAKRSEIMKDWPITTIPNCLNTDIWKPVDKVFARKLLGLPIDAPIVAFGTYGANSSYYKGFDLLLDALKHLGGLTKDVELAIFGQTEPKENLDLGFNVNFMGHFYDDLSLRLFYSAVDMLVVPSRKEAFGQTASESMACGTPVVAFGATGLLDIVDHRSNGYLAKPFDTEDLASGINFILNSSNYDQLCKNAREKAVKKFDRGVVADKYLEIYSKILK